MSMNATYRNAVATEGASLITHLGLVDETGTELTGGSYTRLAVTWTAPSDGTIRPDGDLLFEVPADTTVGGWRGFSASTAGTDYGGEDLTQEAFASAGQYRLLAAQTGIRHDAGA